MCEFITKGDGGPHMPSRGIINVILSANQPSLVTFSESITFLCIRRTLATSAPSTPSSMATSNLLDLEITVVSAKHLKNVNWRNGDLKPYVVFYLDTDYRLATHSDDAGSTCPVWNERFKLPVTRPVHESVLTLEVFHSKVSEAAKPLVGSVKFPLAKLVDSDNSTQSIRTIELLRPSGRPQGKIRVKLALRERPLLPPSHDYRNIPDFGHYYYSAPPPFPPPARDYSYYSGYYSPQPPMPPRPLYNRAPIYSMPSGSVSVPSAPVDFSISNDHKQPHPPPAPANYVVPTGTGPSAPVDYSPYDPKLQKQFGGLNLEEEVSSAGKEKRAETELPARDSYSYSGYRRDY